MKSIWNVISKTVSLVFFGGILLSILTLIARETLLWRGVDAVKKDLRTLSKMTNSKNCSDEFGMAVTDSGQPDRQLRFIDSKAYVLELACPSFPDSPLQQQPRKLSEFITKKPGTAGIIQRRDVTSSYITLVVFQDFVHMLPASVQPWLRWISRGEMVGMQDDQVVSKSAPQEATATPTIDLSSSPVSSCEGYGFSCCDTQTEYGMGDSLENLSSCPANCFARCLPRPLVVSWRSNPIPDWETNSVSLPVGGSLQLYYVLDDVDESGPWNAYISFGDGQEQIVEGKSGMVEHSYRCASSSCMYTASVVVENALGARSVETTVSKITISVGSPTTMAPL